MKETSKPEQHPSRNVNSKNQVTSIALISRWIIRMILPFPYYATLINTQPSVSWHAHLPEAKEKADNTGIAIFVWCWLTMHATFKQLW